VGGGGEAQGGGGEQPGNGGGRRPLASAPLNVQGPSLRQARQLLGLEFLAQGPDDIVEVALKDLVELVESEVDAVIGDPPLGIVVGADALGAVAAADEAPAGLGLLLRRRVLLGGLQPGLQQCHGAGAVLVLGALVLAFHHDAGGQVGDADRRVGLVDVLAAGAGGAEGVDAQVRLVEADLVHLIGLGHHRHGAGGGVDAALGLGGGHPLHPVGAGFELEPGVDILALHPGDDFLEAAVLARALADDLHLPALALGVPAVHAKQVAGEDRRLVAAGAGADLEKDVAPVVGVPGQQQPLQFQLEALAAGLARGDFLLGHFLEIGILEQLPGTGDVRHQLAVLVPGLGNGFEFGVLLGQGAELHLVGDDVAFGEQGADLLVALPEVFDLVENGWLHVLSWQPDWMSNSSWARRIWSSRPSSPAFLRRSVGVCSSLLVRLRARAVSTSSAGWPRCRAARALSSSASRSCSTLWRKARMVPTAFWARSCLRQLSTPSRMMVSAWLAACSRWRRFSSITSLRSSTV